VSATKIVSPAPARDVAYRKTDAVTDPHAMKGGPEGGIHPTDPRSSMSVGEHVTELRDLNLPPGSKRSPYVSLSSNPHAHIGNPDSPFKLRWTVEYIIDLEKVRKEGTQILSHEEVIQGIDDAVRNGEISAHQAEVWKSRQSGPHGEREMVAKGSIPSAAIETRALRAAKFGARFLGYAGVAVTAYDLTGAALESVELGSPRPIAAETVRQAGGWGGGVAGAALGAKLGGTSGWALGPWGAFGLGVGLAVVGGVGGYFGADFLADFVHPN
jgi:hypothetical protein